MYKQFLRRLSPHKEIIILALLFLVLKSFYLLKPHLYGWDEAVYVGMGKYIYSFGTQGLWEDIRPMGLPLLIGGLWKISSIAVELLMIFFAAGSGVLVYFISKKLYGSNVGFVAAVLLLSTPLFFSHASLVMTGIPSTFFVLLGIYLYVEKKHPFLVGCVLGVGTLFRFPQGIAFIALLLVLGRKKAFRDMAIVCTGFFIPFFAFFTFNYMMYHAITGTATDALLRPLIFGSHHQLNPLYPGEWWFYFTQLFMQNFFFVFAVVGIIVSCVRKKYLFAVLLALYFLYFTFIPNKQDRFLLVFLPYLVVFAALGFLFILKKTKHTIPLIILTFFVVVSFVVVVQQNTLDYEWRSSIQHPMVDFFSKLDTFEGPILTTTPLPAVYTNQLYIPFYENPFVALKIYNKFYSVPTVVYSPQFFPCVDAMCQAKKIVLFDMLRERRIAANATFGEYEYVVFTRQ
jgi:4-amino-4-deoxy-L-arabinose transferase-like glycosyltransferase